MGEGRGTAGSAQEGAAAPVVEEVDDPAAVDAGLVDAFVRLIPQLSSSAPPPTADALRQIVTSPATVLFVARASADGPIVGSLTLALFRVPTGMRAWIEDVVVDEAARGAGIGDLLVSAALDRSHREGARTVDLTSRPSRVAAHRLYRRAGFEERETSVYRHRAD